MDLAKYAQDGRKKEKIEAEVRARAGFYASRDAECLGYYVPQGSWDLSASHLIGLLTDLSPLWIHDCWTNRKGSVPIERCDEAKRQDPTGTRAAGASGEHDREGAGQ
jgi:hypothetical protein